MKKIQTDQAPAAIGPYSQAIVNNGLLFTSGQIPLTLDGEIAGKNITSQTEQVMQNISNLLKAVGIGFEQVIKTTCFLADMNDFQSFNEIYANYFVSKPARSCVAVKELPKGVLVEVELIAKVD